MNVDHAVVSRHLRALEELVGTALIHREGGSDRWLTDDGRAYHTRVSAALKDIGDATDLLQRKNDQRLLVWCAPGFAFHWLARRLPDFKKRYPAIDLELRPTDTAPDFTSNQADVDIRYVRGGGATGGDDVRTLEIARPPVYAVASPEYLAGVAPIGRAADLLDCCLIHEDSTEEWRMWLAAQGHVVEEDIPGPRVWHAHLALDAARNGQGIALASELLVAEDIHAGRLVKVCATREPLVGVELGGYSVFGRADRWHVVPQVRLRQWLCDTMEVSANGSVAPVSATWQPRLSADGGALSG